MECITFHSAIHLISCFCSILPFSFTACIIYTFSSGAEKLTNGSHSIAGLKLRVTVGQVPSPLQLEQAITFPSTYSTAPLAMQPPPHVLSQQVMQSAGPVPVPRPRKKKPTSRIKTDDSVLSAAAQGVSVATVDDSQTEDSITERSRPGSVLADAGSPVQATSQSTSQSTPLRTDSLSASLTPISPVVRVVGILPEWDEDLLINAFDDEEEGGGEIEDNGIQIKGNEALITFKHPGSKTYCYKYLLLYIGKSDGGLKLVVPQKVCQIYQYVI